MNCLICNKKIDGESWLSFMNETEKLDCCSYICSNKISDKYPKYWDTVINIEKFNKDPIPIAYIKRKNTFNFEHDMEKIINMNADEYNNYVLNVNDYEKFMNEYNEYKSFKEEVNYYDESDDDDSSVNSDY